MQNREHHSPLIWPTIEENGVTRTKKYAELSAKEKIQADCDLKATNIILQGLPSDIYSLVNHHRVSKDLWERIQLLMQVNTKFLNSLPPKWSKFVTDVKLVKDLHTTNFDQLHAYLQQHELHANEVRIMHSSLAVHVFKQRDYPVDAINKMMSISVYYHHISFPIHQKSAKKFLHPKTTSSHDGRVTVQPVQGRQNSFVVGISGTRANISRTGGNNSGQQRVVKCFNCQGEGHMARQCPKPKRKRDATWFRDKVLLVEAQGNGKVLNEEELEFLADPGVREAKAVLMANLYSYGSNVLFEVPHSENIHNDMLNQSVQDMSYSEQTHLVNYPENEITTLGFQNRFYLKKAQQIRPILYDGSVIAKETNVISIAESEETLMLEEES
ncbi:retrovirus-related pol polyprotein from transposon TNT 1-94 [Tanacetum coccineum]